MRTLSFFTIVFLGSLSWATAKLTPLAPKPDWHELDRYQQTLTRKEFSELLNHIYAPGGAAKGLIDITSEGAKIRTSEGRAPYILKFAATAGSARPVPKYWRRRSEIKPVTSRPLSGVKIAIDPGHIGGKWAKIEERWFQIGKSKPVVEGDMTLQVAKLLISRLEAMGAEVHLTRSHAEPVTGVRPSQLRKVAAASLREKGEKTTSQSIKSESERLFYRASEIRKRAEIVNGKIKPDLVLCLHFNAEGWGDPANPSLVDKNHLHFLLTGAWSRKELEYEDQRFEMLIKLLNRTFSEEKAATQALTKSMVSATKLPPFIYHGPTAVRVGNSDYIWARNLLANRLFECPVVYVEPYVMNSRSVFKRIQAGDYQGRKSVGGQLLPSIYREYADSVAAGLAKYYSGR